MGMIIFLQNSRLKVRGQFEKVKKVKARMALKNELYETIANPLFPLGKLLMFEWGTLIFDSSFII